eukprot:gene43143-52732_t
MFQTSKLLNLQITGSAQAQDFFYTRQCALGSVPVNSEAKRGMDPIEFFIKSNRRFSVNSFLNTHARLVVIQANQGHITYDDVVKTLSVPSSASSPGPDISAYAGVLYEAVFMPIVTKKGIVAHKLLPESLNSDQALIDRIVLALTSHCSSPADLACVEEFKREAQGSTLSSAAPSTIQPQQQLQGNTHISPASSSNAIPESESRPDFEGHAAAGGTSASMNNTEPKSYHDLLSRFPENIDMADDMRGLSSLPRLDCEKS